MRQSALFAKTLRSAPQDEVSRNAELLHRAGFIHKELAGAYSYLPLGLRVLRNIENIIRSEMDAIGGQEFLMTALQEPSKWKQTGRWDDAAVDVWFKTRLKNDAELGLGWSHEEMITGIMREFVHSYKDLPLYAYQIQTKFRNEMRAKSGLMRCREFSMKDMYSFSRTEQELDEFYEKVKDAYMRIFERCGLGDATFITFSSGGSFSKYSHEFQTLSAAGEDTIFLDRQKGLAVNKEVLSDEVLSDLSLERDDLEEVKAIEVGNIFKQKTKFTEPLGLVFTDEDGVQKPVVMGAYGIGPGRVMGTIVETHYDSAGICWPASVAPFAVHLVSLCKEPADVSSADSIYKDLTSSGIEVLYDDRDARPGEKFADADLMGIPLRVVVSAKTLAEKSVEIKERTASDSRIIPIGGLKKELSYAV